MSERLLHRHRRCRMAQARGVVHVRAAVHARGLLRDVVRLVGDAARRQVERGTCRIDGAKVRGGDVERLVPANHAEARLAGAAHHRLRQPPEVAQLLRRQRAERRHVAEHARIERGRGVQPQQLQPHHAQVRAGHRPVAEALSCRARTRRRRPCVRIRHANGSSSRFAHATRAMSRKWWGFRWPIPVGTSEAQVEGFHIRAILTVTRRAMGEPLTVRLADRTEAPRKAATSALEPRRQLQPRAVHGLPAAVSRRLIRLRVRVDVEPLASGEADEGDAADLRAARWPGSTARRRRRASGSRRGRPSGPVRTRRAR